MRDVAYNGWSSPELVIGHLVEKHPEALSEHCGLLPPPRGCECRLDRM